MAYDVYEPNTRRHDVIQRSLTKRRVKVLKVGSQEQHAKQQNN